MEILISALLVDIDTHVQEDFHVGDSILVGTKPLLDIELHESQTVAESAKIQWLIDKKSGEISIWLFYDCYTRKLYHKILSKILRMY